MPEIFSLLILLVWLVGAWIRVYKQARYYQIEEYMSARFLRWQLRKRERLLPARPFAIWLVGAALSLLLGEAPESALPTVITLLAAIVAVLPPDEGEIKRKFVRTQRATRLLIAAGALAAIAMLLFLITLNTVSLPVTPSIRSFIFSLAGLTIFLLAPMFLIAGNILMTPVESLLRRQFIRHARQTIATAQPTIIGITGSYGKTTTKNFLLDILSSQHKVYATPKSYNTLMGICLAINHELANDYSIEYFISEMGAYVPGEIKRICALTPPHIGIVVDIGPQHLERFGSLENVARAKYELIEQLPPDGLGVFNWDNPYAREMYERGYPENRIAVSKTVSPESAPPTGPRYIATDIQQTLEGLAFTVIDTLTGERQQFQAPLFGEHNVTNLLLATAVSIHEGMTLRDVAFRARLLQPAESRLVRQTGSSGITIINDSYSANPVGAINALKILGLHNSGKRLLVTPGMVELGDLQSAENRKLGILAAQYATHIILVGMEQTISLKEGIISAGFPEHNLRVVNTLSEAVQWYQENLATGDTVLFLNDLPDTY